MDPLARHLRDGAVRLKPEACPIAVVADSLEAIGGSAVFSQILSRYLEAVRDQRSQASHVCYVALEYPPPQAVVIGGTKPGIVTVVDVHRAMTLRWQTAAARLARLANHA